ncbi:MAG: class I SAM-dependent methyltransferase [Actinobacteria bacterium]|nr:class I SAM-dependent methyltransferase [Actinomycetota bacterium]
MRGGAGTASVHAHAGDVAEAYDAFAPFYDAFTADYNHESWMADVEGWAREAGLRGRRLLDVACGTGASFVPMLRRGYEVCACDISPAMVARAREKIGPGGAVVIADMRNLPWRDRFDLATCVDDSMNYMLSEVDLVAALSSIRDALAPGGILVFDTNSLATYRSVFASHFTVEAGRNRFLWEGEGSEFMPPGETASVSISRVTPRGNVPVGRHVQRHHPIEELREACDLAGLECKGFRGELPGGGMTADPDEESSTKIVCMAARPPD